jgi:hypothetical protein
MPDNQSSSVERSSFDNNRNLPGGVLTCGAAAYLEELGGTESEPDLRCRRHKRHLPQKRR